MSQSVVLILGFCLLPCFHMSPDWYFLLNHGDASFRMLHAGGRKKHFNKLHSVTDQRPCWKEFRVAWNYSNNVTHMVVPLRQNYQHSPSINHFYRSCVGIWYHWKTFLIYLLCDTLSPSVLSSPSLQTHTHAQTTLSPMELLSATLLCSSATRRTLQRSQQFLFTRLSRKSHVTREDTHTHTHTAVLLHSHLH